LSKVLPPLSLYVHIPWCVKKCPYCDFNSHESATIPEQGYFDALLKDLELDLVFVQGRELSSIFFGGGTPSLMSGKFYQRFISEIAQRIPFSDTIEITMEANPGTTEASRFFEYRAAGINRLSIGVQSFGAPQLKALGRIHSADEAVRAVEQAKAAGFTNFNLDLMHGLPEQSAEQALDDIDRAISLAPNHLSWYQLTIEKNTEFYSQPPILPKEETLWDIQERGAEKLQAAGYAQYEVSAFAKPGMRARHNLNYWTFGDYLGIGAGAHGKVTYTEVASNNKSNTDSMHLLRYRKSRQPKDYLKPRILYRVGEEEIAQQDLGFEFLMNVLRLKEGVSEDSFMARTGLELQRLEPQLSTFRAQGLMHASRLQVTDKGFLFLNTILEKFSDL